MADWQRQFVSYVFVGRHKQRQKSINKWSHAYKQMQVDHSPNNRITTQPSLNAESTQHTEKLLRQITLWLLPVHFNWDINKITHRCECHLLLQESHSNNSSKRRGLENANDQICCFTPGGYSRESVSNWARLLLKIQDGVAAELFLGGEGEWMWVSVSHIIKYKTTICDAAKPADIKSWAVFYIFGGIVFPYSLHISVCSKVTVI